MAPVQRTNNFQFKLKQLQNLFLLALPIRESMSLGSAQLSGELLPIGIRVKEPYSYTEQGSNTEPGASEEDPLFIPSPDLGLLSSANRLVSQNPTMRAA